MLKIDQLLTPCYIADLETFEKNIRNIDAFVKCLYPKFRIGYSYKTNYYLPFLHIAKHTGCYAEIVSPEEFNMCKHFEEPANNIIYNGVIPDFENKLAVALMGGIVNLENIHEFREFVKYSNEVKREIEIGVRVNFDVGNGLISRFGIDIDSPEFKEIADFNSHPYLKIKCVHFHLGGARAPEYFRTRVQKTVSLARLLGARIVDIGGNIYGNMGEDFKAQLPFTAPTTMEVCTAIGEEMAKCCPQKDLELIAECGSPVCSDAMHLLTTITNVNHVRGKTFITCDCRNTDAGWSISKYDPSHQHFGKQDNVMSHATVCGCECREKDILIRNYNLPANVGDRILIKNIGSYSYNVVNNFITLGCDKVYDIKEVLW